jgi:hypothetical protein
MVHSESIQHDGYTHTNPVQNQTRALIGLIHMQMLITFINANNDTYIAAQLIIYCLHTVHFILTYL